MKVCESFLIFFECWFTMLSTDGLFYCLVAIRCFDAGPLQCTPPLLHELSRPSFQAFYSACEVRDFTYTFWLLASVIVEMLHNQVSHNLYILQRNIYQLTPEPWGAIFISDPSTAYLRTLQKENPDKLATLVAYEAHYSHVLRIESSKPVSSFLFSTFPYFRSSKSPDYQDTLHPQWQKFEFTKQHSLVILWSII